MKHIDQHIRDIMYKAYKPAPERFRYTVAESIREAEQSAPVKHRFSKGTRIALAVILIAVLLPTAVFGASKLIGLIAQPVGSYGVELSVESRNPSDYPEYVKMHIETPEGFIEVPNTARLKYCSLSAEDPYTDGFSINPFRPAEDGFVDIADYAEDFVELTVANHKAYKINSADPTQRAFDQIYVYYENVNVVVLIYYKNVTDQQLTDFIEGITFTEGTVDDHTDIGAPDSFIRQDDIPVGEEYALRENYIEISPDTEFSFAEYDENFILTDPNVTCKINGIRVHDNVEELDKDNFTNPYRLDKVTDESGNLLPHTREVVDYGDGVNTKDELICSEEVAQKLVLIDLTYTNLTDQELTFYAPWYLYAMTKNSDGSITHAEIIDADQNIVASEYCSSEIFYMSDHGDGEYFYSPSIGAGEAKTITIGYLADADKLDKLYLQCCPSADGVFSPEYPKDNQYTYFLIKVL